MRADYTRIMVSVVREGDKFRWTATFHPGNGKPRVTSTGTQEVHDLALITAWAQAEKLINDSRSAGRAA